MRTTINIDDNLFRDLMSATQSKSKTEAVKTAIIEYLRLKRKERVLSMRGKLDIDDGWKDLRQQEIMELSNDH